MDYPKIFLSSIFACLWLCVASSQELAGTLWKNLEVKEGKIGAVASSATGNCIAIACPDNTVRIHFVGTDREINLAGHNGTVSCLAFHPNGRMLASGGKDRLIVLWDAENGKEIRKLANHLEEVTCLAFSPDGRFLASGSGDKNVLLWSVDDGKCLFAMTGHQGAITQLIFKFEFLLSLGKDDGVKLWKIDRPSQASPTLSLHPKTAEQYHERGHLRRAQGNLDGAISDYSQAIQLDSKYAQAYYNLAGVYSLRSASHPKTLDGQRAREEDESKALECLNQAIVEGFKDWAHFFKNSALSPLYKDPRYLQMVETKIEKAHKIEQEELVKTKDLQGKSRPISFEVQEKGGTRRTDALEILVNGKKISQQDLFLPGYEYDVMAKFKEFETARDRVQIEPGEGLCILSLRLKPLKEYEFYTRERSMVLDKIEYDCVCYADNNLIEPHLVDVTKKGVYYYYTVRLDPDIRSFKVAAGYRYVSVPLHEVKGYLHLENISLPLLAAHLGKITETNSIGYLAALMALENILKNRSNISRIKYAPMREIAQLINYIESWEMEDPQDRMRVRRLVEVLEDTVGHQRTKEE